MSPMTLVDGSDRQDTRLARERDAAQRRLVELAAAIREHEQKLRKSRPLSLRAPDDHLYRRLRQICGDSTR
ncbi:MAG: hypothetical protein ACRDKV_11275 [Solirubrobacterales bacterium]